MTLLECITLQAIKTSVLAGVIYDFYDYSPYVFGDILINVYRTSVRWDWLTLLNINSKKGMLLIISGS